MFHQGQYIALFMEAGLVVFQFDLGTGPAIMRSQHAYNDGNFHLVEVARDRKQGLLKVCYTDTNVLNYYVPSYSVSVFINGCNISLSVSVCVSNKLYL